MGARTGITRLATRRMRGRVALLAIMAAAFAAVVAAVAPDWWHDDDTEVIVLHGPGGHDIAAVTVFRGAGAAAPTPQPTEADSAATFTLCGWPPHHDCVIDGDTLYVGNAPIRIADIDAPETHDPQCSREADLGARATRRLLALLNDGPITLQAPGGLDVDRHGHHLRTVLRNGRSLGAVLVTEGLAEPWRGPSARWCG